MESMKMEMKIVVPAELDGHKVGSPTVCLSQLLFACLNYCLPVSTTVCPQLTLDGHKVKALVGRARTPTTQGEVLSPGDLLIETC